MWERLSGWLRGPRQRHEFCGAGHCILASLQEPGCRWQAAVQGLGALGASEVREPSCFVFCILRLYVCEHRRFAGDSGVGEIIDCITFAAPLSVGYITFLLLSAPCGGSAAC